MTPFPLALDQMLGHWGQYIVYLFLGVAFGWTLETAGFGRSTKLAAQFYFKEMTVLKVMFTGIVVAMLLIFLASGLGLLDYNLLWVNPTYLVPGIVGGLIMGFGFIIGGFCPGTSLVGAVTGKLDALFFVVGGLFGIFLFGETVGSFETWWNSTFMGRFTLPDLFGTSVGVVVLLVVIMALGAFAFAEVAERLFGDKALHKQPKWRYGAAGGGIALALGVLIIGQPTTVDRWARIAAQKEPLLTSRAVYIEQGEILKFVHDHTIKTVLLDVRSEADYNQFHVLDSRNVPLDNLPTIIAELNTNPSNTVVFLFSNDEAAATAAWKTLVAESVPNVYIAAGGVNAWLDTFSDDAFKAEHKLKDAPNGADDTLRYTFAAALGARLPAANPNPDKFKLTFEDKVKLNIKRGPTSGGCG